MKKVREFPPCPLLALGQEGLLSMTRAPLGRAPPVVPTGTDINSCFLLPLGPEMQ